MTAGVVETCWGEDWLRVALGIRHVLERVPASRCRGAVMPCLLRPGVGQRPSPACQEEKHQGVPGLWSPLLPWGGGGREPPIRAAILSTHMAPGPHTELCVFGKSPRIFGPQFPDVTGGLLIHPQNAEGSSGTVTQLNHPLQQPPRCLQQKPAAFPSHPVPSA